MLNDYVRAAVESRDREMESAINRFRECGVEIERFSIQTYQDRPTETALCVDGIPRFTWRLVCDLPGWR